MDDFASVIFLAWDRTMGRSSLYSIGHGNKDIDVFITELRSYGIQYLLDIRTKPFSKWNPQYNQHELKTVVEKSGISYVFVGDKLGGLPIDTSCYDAEGKVIYDVIKDKQFFLTGLSRLITAHTKKIALAIMCSESKPQECHRSKLIGRELLRNGISINHIITSGLTKSQETVMNELTKGKGTVDLFGDETNFTSRKTY